MLITMTTSSSYILVIIYIVSYNLCYGEPYPKNTVNRNKHKGSHMGRNMSGLENDPEAGRIRRSAKYTEVTLAIGKESYYNLREYEKQRKKGRNAVSGNITVGSLKNQHPACNRRKISCDKNSKHRRFDGRCNNLKHVDWGSSFIGYTRLVPAEYSDGFNKPKGLHPQKELPNPRLISAHIHRDSVKPDPTLTNMVPQIGQFLDHDQTLAPESDRRCCTTEKDGIDCWPITIPKNDYFYSKLSNPQTCMDFTRSTAFCFPSASAIREQFNINTAFIDASMIYGSDDERARVIREHKGGRLLLNDKFANIIPSVQQVEKREGHSLNVSFMGKLIAGDNRVNETPGLTVMHTLWVWEHNRLAKEIQKASSNWNDEKIYQLARRIVTAEWQNIIYSHYLPIILGSATMKKYKLDLDSSETFSDYIDTLNPGIYHSFATAAYRFGHSMVNGLYRLFKGDRESGSFHLRNTFFNSDHIETPDSVHVTLAGLMVQNSQAFDRFISEDLTNFLFKLKAEDFGSDLVARNIHRGRDHGLPSYSTYREICGLSALTSWDDRPTKEFNYEAWKKLRDSYKRPKDIDLYSGGLVEKNVRGAVTGPTFNCLKAMQFYTLKFGDRFFFTHRNQAGSFTKNQLKSLRSRTLGDIICENSKVQKTTEDVFKIQTAKNPWKSCTDSSRSKINVEDFIE